MNPAATTSEKTTAKAAAPGVVARVVPAQRLEQAPQAVVEVEAQDHVGDDVDRRHPGDAEAGEDVVVDVVGPEVGVGGAPGQVHQVVDDVEQEDGAAPPHRPRRVVELHQLAARVVLRAGPPRLQPEGGGGVDVEHHRRQQHAANDPQQRPVGEQRIAQRAEPVGVSLELLRPEEELEVAHHVAEDEAEEGDPGDRHHRLLAHRRAIEGQEPGHVGPILRLFGELVTIITSHSTRSAAAAGAGGAAGRAGGPRPPRCPRPRRCPPRPPRTPPDGRRPAARRHSASAWWPSSVARTSSSKRARASVEVGPAGEADAVGLAPSRLAQAQEAGDRPLDVLGLLARQGEAGEEGRHQLGDQRPQGGAAHRPLVHRLDVVAPQQDRRQQHGGEQRRRRSPPAPRRSCASMAGRMRPNSPSPRSPAATMA